MTAPAAVSVFNPLDWILSLDNTVVATSRDVAAAFGRNHRDVLRAIDNLNCSAEFRHRNYTETSYAASRRRTFRAIDISRDGFVLLIMGFTGRCACEIKEAYIAEFNAAACAARTTGAVQ